MKAQTESAKPASPAKPTPGPWTKGEGPGIDSCVYGGHEDGRYLIADCHGDDMYTPQSETVPNARLIAAAPATEAERIRLTAALRYCLRELRHTRLAGPWPDAKLVAEAVLMGPGEIAVRAASVELTDDGRALLASLAKVQP